MPAATTNLSRHCINSLFLSAARWLHSSPLFGISSPTMSRELLILRHAKSAWDTDAATDFDRPLAKRGRKAAPRVGQFLLRQGLVPDYLVSSPAQRAKQTVTLACKQMEIDPQRIVWDRRIYGGWRGTLLDVLRECPSHTGRALIAGHNPGLEVLLENLCNDRVPMPADGKLLPTAAVAHLEIFSEWSELGNGSAGLLSITRSRSLPPLAGESA
jgi:phosphohistidine phosphatase